MARYRHLKINEIAAGDLSNIDDFGALDTNVQCYRSYWPKHRRMPTVGWIEDLPNELNMTVQQMIMSLSEKAQEYKNTNDIDYTEFDKTVGEITTNLRKSKLVHNSSKRVEITTDSLKIVLDWLRIVPYSTIDVMELVLDKSRVATRNTLNKFVKEGWLIRDEIEWPGSTRDKHLFGISSKGLYHLLSNGAVEPPASRDFKRNRVKASNAPHVLNLQLARLYYQLIDNPKGEFRRYRQDRDLTFFQSTTKAEQEYKWPTYSDAIIDNSHYRNSGGRPMKIAIEIEQHHKGSKRYKALIKAHIDNIEDYVEHEVSDRYDRVIYLFADQNEKNNYQRLFHKIMMEISSNGKKDQTEQDRIDRLKSIKKLFIFDTYGDLSKRIGCLGDSAIVA